MDPGADTDLRERLDQIDEDYRKRADSNRALITVFARRTFAILAVLVVVQLAVGGWSVILTSRGAEANTALCALRDDLKRRVASSEDFLLKHPAGIPGIPVQTIRDSIANQQRTIIALSDLSCG